MEPGLTCLWTIIPYRNEVRFQEVEVIVIRAVGLAAHWNVTEKIE